MSQADEAPGVRFLSVAQTIIDETADRDVRLIETCTAGEHAGIDPTCIHHPCMGGQIRKQRIEQIMRIAVAIEIDSDFIGLTFE